jgi:hypothetical protein
MALGSSHRNEYQDYFLTVLKSGSLNLLKTSRPVMGLLYLYPLLPVRCLVHSMHTTDH